VCVCVCVTVRVTVCLTVCSSTYTALLYVYKNVQLCKSIHPTSAIKDLVAKVSSEVACKNIHLFPGFYLYATEERDDLTRQEFVTNILYHM